MAFSFGAAPATPAPAFGSTTTSTTPAPSAPLFGSNPAPAPSGGLFGSNPAPAPSGSLFGSTAAPAPATGGIFGSNPAPAPSTGFSFGGASTTPAPAPLFGSTPAPSTGFGTTTSPFAQPPAATQQQAAPPVMMITASTPYSSLPPEAKRAIDTIHQELMRHKKIMNTVETMAPVLLREPLNTADEAAGGNTSNLQQQLHELQHSLQGISANIDKCRKQAIALQRQTEESTTQSIMYGLWPVEAVAVHRGVKLSDKKSAPDPSVRDQLQKLLDQQVAHVDRVERIPSPYMWKTLEELERRVATLMQQVSKLNEELDANATDDVMDVASIVHSQTDAIARVAFDVTRVHEHMERLRTQYRRTERGEDILKKADVAEFERQRRLDQEAQQYFMKAAQQQAPASTAPSTTTAPAPGGLFGSNPVPAPSGGFFGNPAPAPSGGLFGSTPAAAPTAAAPSGGLFGSNPAPAPATTAPSATGTTPAPAPVGTGAPPAPSLFGATPAPATNFPAPAPGFSFAGAPATKPSSTASTPRTGSRTRNRSGRR